MEGQLDIEIRARLLDVIGGSLTIEDFEDWFVGVTWDVDSDLVADVNLLLVERDHLTSDQVRNEILDLVRTIHMGVERFSTSLTSSVTSLPPANVGGSVTYHVDLVHAGT
jgi:hypothetical protein